MPDLNDHQCPDCEGTGNSVPHCKTCEDRRWVYDEEDGGTMCCPDCGGDACETCGGTGERVE